MSASLFFLLNVLLATFIVHLSAEEINHEPSVKMSDDLAQMLSQNSLISTRANAIMVQNLQRKVADTTCNPNVCFALDGGDQVGASDFKRQLEFVQLVAAIVGVDERSVFSAVQYTQPIKPISRATGDTDRFLLRTENVQQQASGNSLIKTGLDWCITQTGESPIDVNKVVVLADARSKFVGNAVRLSRRFRNSSRGNAVCMVGVGFRGNIGFLRRITGTRSRVFTINQYFELIDVIDQLVFEICGV